MEQSLVTSLSELIVEMKEGMKGVYPAYSLLLCSLKFVMNVSGVLPLQN